MSTVLDEDRDTPPETREDTDQERATTLPWAVISLVAVGAIALLTLPGAVIIVFVMFFLDDADTEADPQANCSADGIYNTVTLGETDDAIPKLAYEIAQRKGASDRVILAMFETALTESGFKNLANDGIYGPEDQAGTPITPEEAATAGESMRYPYDGTGSDHTSMGPWQFQLWWAPKTDTGAWDIKTLMDPRYQAETWVNKATEIEAQTPGTAGELAQAVQGSQFPERYDQHEAAARTLIDHASGNLDTINADTAGASESACTDEEGGEGEVIGELGNGEWLAPLPGGVLTSGYGYRPCIGSLGCGPLITNHAGVDFATPGDAVGTIIAPTDLEITNTVNSTDWNGSYIMAKTLDGKYVMNFHHVEYDSIKVKTNDKVAAGTPMATEGATGMSEGEHLHWQIHTGDAPTTYPSSDHAIDPTKLLIQKGILDPRDPNL